MQLGRLILAALTAAALAGCGKSMSYADQDATRANAINALVNAERANRRAEEAEARLDEAEAKIERICGNIPQACY